MRTITELGFPADAVQYTHFPIDWTVCLENLEYIFHPTVEEDSLYERVCTRIVAVDHDEIQAQTLSANSERTGNVVEDAEANRPRVVYPPVDTAEFDPQP